MQPPTAAHVYRFMRTALSLCLIACTACGGTPASRPTIGNATTGERSSAEETHNACTPGMELVVPLTQQELELAHTPGDTAALRERLLGVWDGNDFTVDGELGAPGSNPSPAEPHIACFDLHGSLTTDPTSEPPGPECRPRVVTYALRREPEMDNALLLDVDATGGCPGDASFDAPYAEQHYVHRLDDQFLVLIDGSTGDVSGYRRRLSVR